MISLADTLSFSRVYSSFQRLISGSKTREEYTRRHLKVSPNERVLDIGCGPGSALEGLPETVDYVGFDMNPKYIRSCRERFGHRARFFEARVEKGVLAQEAPFDLVMANGVLHHLDDQEAVELFEIAFTALKPGGRLVTLDGCFTTPQSPIARFILKRDRGQFVRDEAAYLGLARRCFPNVTSTLRTDMLRVPYTHIIMECRKPCTT